MADDDDDRDDDLVDEATSFNPVAWHGKSMEQLLSTPRGIPVSNSDELTRIVNLPRRPVVTGGTATAEALIELQMRKYSRGERACRCGEIDARIKSGKRKCLKRLKWEQAWALHEIHVVGGLIASCPVGLGKTLLNIIAALALRDCPLALLLIPSSLRLQIIKDYQLIAEHFYVPNFTVHLPGKKQWKSALQYMPSGELAPFVHVVPYNFISGTKNSAWIDNLRPSAIISDEVDALGDMESSRTMRIMRYFDEHQGSTRFCGWTGSLTDNSVKEFAHLYALALRLKSPLPRDRQVIDEWSRCLDAVPNPCPIGALRRLLEPTEGDDRIRHAFHRRLAETAGIIMIGGRQIIRTDAGDEVINDIREKVAPEIPSRVLDGLDKARDFFRPDTLAADAKDDDVDEIMVDPLEQARVVRQVATGVFYRWNWDGVERELANKWLAARRLWHGELRYKMLRGETHLDSAKLCEDAAKRAWGDAEPNPNLPNWKADHWPAWRDIRDACSPRQEAVWLDKWLVHDAAEWAASNRGIVWYGMVEFARELGKVTGLKVYGEGSAKELAEATGEQSIITSIKSHGRGTNGLQFIYDQQLIINTLASARMYQQCLDSETEVLTDRGWLKIDDDWRDVRAAAYDINDGAITWSATERVDRRLGDEKMWGIQNPHLDIRVTAGHRMIVEPAITRPVRYQSRRFVTADEMPRVGRIPVAGMQPSTGVPLTDAELTFLGLVMSDGNIHPTNGVVRIFQSERYPQVIELIESVLTACRFRYIRRVDTKPTNFGERSPLHSWEISRWSRKNPGVGLRGWHALASYISKDFPPALRDMTAAQLHAFLRGLYAGDGSKTEGTYAYDRYVPGTHSICNARKQVVDELQALCVRRNLRCNVSASRNVWMLRISEDTTWSLSTGSGDSRPVWAEVPCSSDERVWCVTVSTGAIVTRRNGKVAIVGNCLGRLRRDGQQSAVVQTEIYLHTAELRKTLEQALRRGEYVQDVTTEEQMLIEGWRGYASDIGYGR